jgi:hypothetical protein
MAARSRAIAAENDDKVYRALVNAGGAGLAPGAELAELVDLPPSTTRAALARLQARGVVKRDGRRRVWALMSRAEAGLPEPGAAQQQLERVEQRRRQRAHDHDLDRDQFVETRRRLQHKLTAMISSLDGRRLTDCPAEQRAEAYGVAERLRTVLKAVTRARSWETMHDADDRAADPYRRGEALVEQIDRDRNTRREIEGRADAMQRTHAPVLAAMCDMAANLHAMAKRSHGAALDSLNQQSRQLEQTSPIGQAERLRGIAALSEREVEHARAMEESARRMQAIPPFNPYR